MSSHHNAERLYDFEATLRLVDSALDELQVLGGEPGGAEEHEGHAHAASADVPALTPVRVYREVQEGLHALRHGRTILARTTAAKDHGSADPEAALVSATDALGALDRALQLMARCEGSGDHPALFDAIRAEIRSAMASLRRQDVTEQQLSYAASILLDMDGRLTQLTQMLDPYRDASAPERAPEQASPGAGSPARSWPSLI